MYTRRRGATGYDETGEYGYGGGTKSARSRNWGNNTTATATTATAKNQIYVNRSFQLDTSPRDEEGGRPGDPDQFSQDQIELVTHAQGVGWAKAGV